MKRVRLFSAISACVVLQAAAARDEFQVQAPGARIEIGAGIANGFSYRDLLLSKHTSTSVFAGAARAGFAASAWLTKTATAGTSYEGMLSYSYKFPWLDAHLGYVKSHVASSPLFSGESVRLALTNNLSSATRLSVSADHDLSNQSKILGIALAHELGTFHDTRFAVRASFSSWRLEAGRVTGRSVQLDALRKLASDTYINLHLGGVASRTYDRPASDSALNFGFSLTRQF